MSSDPAQVDRGQEELTRPLTMAVCTNRPGNLDRIVAALAARRAGDDFLVVVDVSAQDLPGGYVETLLAGGARVLRNPENKGLSYSRNRALEECGDGLLVYLDDDVSVGSDVLDAIAAAAACGAAIVGVRLRPAFPPGRARPWWLTEGQYHYLGVHRTGGQHSTWGACMAVDATLARAHGIRFRDDLGRRGRALQSGDDTTFLQELRACGAREIMVDSVAAVHHVAPERMTLRYLLRRAWWQGRSERRRANAWPALRKEWRRNTAPPSAGVSRVRRGLLGVVFLSAVLFGEGWEAAFSGRNASRR